MIELLRERVIPITSVFLLGSLAGAGLIPLLSLGNDEPPEPETPTVTTPATSTQSTIVEVEPTLPTLPGLDANVSRALLESGYAVRMNRAELEAEIDADVVRVLEASDAVVTVFDSEEKAP